ncbi:FecCD family ABC transporter permease [Sediminibacillus albus]|uniref:Iron complex transport system permease protein n=1 Tax=Sediminibacillus albus TaxID=407036 RepID=A0A1G9AJW8_9BACI|nr:iron ABC transporter permease [Sediminibacillus albus]SDK27649.1 iron complex transport system permease protein [Sediminibacillus albus]
MTNNFMKNHPFLFMGTLFLFLVLAILVCLNTGAATITPGQVFQTFIGNGGEKNALILFEFRLPRIVIAILVGAGLAVSGAILQSITKNDIAEPGIVGINAGAGLAVVLFIFFFQGSIAELGGISTYFLPAAALAGALSAAILIYIFAWKQGIAPVRLILVGIGVNSGFNAILIIIQLKMDPQDFSQAITWLSGSIWGSDWSYVLAILPWIFVLIPLAFLKASSLDIIHMGDEVAAGLGIHVEKERAIMLLVAVALAGACVSVAGNIAFLGLVAPHLVRRIIGPKHQYLLPASALMGALLLLIADTVGKNLLAPSEIPVGIVVSALGAPYFIYLLLKTN